MKSIQCILTFCTVQMTQTQDPKLHIRNESTDVLELVQQDSSRGKKHPLQFSEYVKNSQEKRVKALVQRDDPTPKHKKLLEGRATSRGTVTFRESNSSYLHKDEDKNSMKQEEEFRTNLARVTFTAMEKRRGFNSKDFLFLNKPKTTREKQIIANPVTERNKEPAGNFTEQVLSIKMMAILNCDIGIYGT